MRTISLYAATWGTGLVAGLFVAFSIAVMPGLRGADDHTFVVTMQRINVSIVNPLFLLLFMGTPVLLAVVAFLAPERRWWLVALGLTVAGLLVTLVVNIPLNNTLAAAGSKDPASARAAFENTWTVFNVVRTLLMSGSFIACLVALRVP